MPRLIEEPSRIEARGKPSKTIEEFVGRINSGTDSVSIARMRSPEGWREPGQAPDFEEISLVLRGVLRVEFKGGRLDVKAGQAVIVERGEWVRYSTPETGGTEYLAVCMPAFSPDRVRRDPEEEG